MVNITNNRMRHSFLVHVSRSVICRYRLQSIIPKKPIGPKAYWSEASDSAPFSPSFFLLSFSSSSPFPSFSSTFFVTAILPFHFSSSLVFIFISLFFYAFSVLDLFPSSCSLSFLSFIINPPFFCLLLAHSSVLPYLIFRLFLLFCFFSCIALFIYHPSYSLFFISSNRYFGTVTQ